MKEERILFRLYSPSSNLGCAGLRIGGFYIDMYRKPHLGTFMNIDRIGKMWLSRHALRWEGRKFLLIRFMKLKTAKSFRIKRVIRR